MPTETLRPSPRFRRLCFGLLCSLTGLLLAWLAWRTMAPGGWTGWEILGFAAFLGLLPWAALSAVNGAIGGALLLGSRDPAAAVMPQLRVAPVHTPLAPPGLRTGILCCVRDEPVEAVLPPVERLLAGLEATGAGGSFTFWLLSDTRDDALAAREAAGVAALALRFPGRAHYRRRRENTGFKAGNVMEFLDRHAGGLDLFLCLDADSGMTAPAVLRLVGCMEADPRLAIVQPLIVGRPAESAFPRLFQFGMRAGMRAWATGQAWWQGDEGPYWGHNAVLRIAPFRAHARLAPLPDGRPILSHDQVEAAQLQAAGWKVRCLPVEEGSLEGNPPTLPDFLARDSRWGEGNMQYWRLLLRPGLRAMGRWQLLQAILLFAGAPLWVLLAVAAVGNVAAGGGEATPRAALALLLGATWLCTYAPKLMGYAELLPRPGRAAPYGGRGAVLRGAGAEILFTTLLDPVSLLNKALVLIALPFGRRGGWGVQRREARGLRLREALRRLWPHTLLGVLLLLALGLHSLGALLWGLPFLLGLALAVPFGLLTAGPRFSALLRRHG
ncbi:glucans biosynthesis glucosyltransferase MdoH, partial [Roseomonas sp. TAS13]|uniref:glucans biosynthesis glucosyltransferase MdoH n=1 Tax=Roseomonas sp. TAS13 TaxID=1926319 RepID=UPI00096AAB13